jgi:predicted GTPase
VVAARRYGAADIIDPRPYAVGKLAETFKIYPEIGNVLPAMGYGDQQIKDLAATIAKSDCDAVIIATPIDLQRVIKIEKPCAKVGYNLQEIGHPGMEDVMADFIRKAKG